MAKLDKLTPEQEKLMITHRQEWMDFILKSGKDLTIDEIKDDIAWIYEKIGLKKPLIFIADSYLEEKLMTNYIISLGKNPEQLKSLLLRQIQVEMIKQMMYNTTAQIWTSLFESVPALKEQVQKQLAGSSKIDLHDLVYGNSIEPGILHSHKDKLNRKISSTVTKDVMGYEIETERVVRNLGESIRDATEESMAKLNPENNKDVHDQIYDVDGSTNGVRDVWTRVEKNAGRDVMDKVNSAISGKGDSILDPIARQIQDKLSEMQIGFADKPISERVKEVATLTTWIMSMKVLSDLYRTNNSVVGLHGEMTSNNDAVQRGVQDPLQAQTEAALKLIGKRNSKKKQLTKFANANSEGRTGGIKDFHPDLTMFGKVQENYSDQWDGQVIDKSRMALMTELQTIFQNMFDSVSEQDKQKVKDFIKSNNDQSGYPTSSEMSIHREVGHNTKNALSEDMWLDITREFRETVMRELNTIFNSVSAENDIQDTFHKSPHMFNAGHTLQEKVWASIGEQLAFQLHGIKNGIEIDTERTLKHEDVGKIRDKAHNQLIEQTTDMDYNVYNKIYDTIGGNTSTFLDTIRAQLTAQVGDKLKDAQHDIQTKMVEKTNEDISTKLAWAVSSAITGEVFTQLALNMGEPLQKSMGMRTRHEPEKLEFVEQSMGILYHSWVSFYEFFRRIKVVDEYDPTNADYIRYADYLKKGVWSVQYYTNFVVVCKLPLQVKLDDQNRLHSMAGSAIVWRTPNVNNYFIHGVSFPDALYKKIQDGTISAKELLGIQNQEQKSAAIKEVGFDKIIHELGDKARCIDISRKRIMQNGKWVTLENELYQISGIFRFDMKTVKCRCTSTDRVFFIDVPPDMENANEAMAWSLDMTRADYEKMTVET